jgi:hypothetical protein
MVDSGAETKNFVCSWFDPPAAFSVGGVVSR